MARFSLPSFSFEKLAALGRIQRILICVGAFLILVGGFYYLIYMPKSSAISQLTNNCERLQARLVKTKAAAKDLKKFQSQYKEAEAKFKVALRLLPDKREIPGLLESISKSGTDSGLEFLLFKPDKEISRGFYAEIPVNIEVKGGYHNLAMFFDRVARLSRIVNILNIKIGAGKEAEGLNASCVVMTYRFLEAPEAPAAGTESKRGKRG